MDKLAKITEPLVDAVTPGSWLLDLTLFYCGKTDLSDALMHALIVRCDPPHPLDLL